VRLCSGESTFITQRAFKATNERTVPRQEPIPEEEVQVAMNRPEMNEAEENTPMD
jgi:hypothetical protein